MLTRYYTIQEVADMLGCSRRSVYRAIKAGKLNGRKVGHQWRFSQEDYEAYVNGTSDDVESSFDVLFAAVTDARSQLTTAERMKLMSALAGE